MAFIPRWARAKRPRAVGPWETYLGRVFELNDAPRDPLVPFSNDEKWLIAQERLEFPVRYAFGVNPSDVDLPSDGV